MNHRSMIFEWVSKWSAIIFLNRGLCNSDCFVFPEVQCVPLATEPGISLIILTPMKILQRNLNRSTFVVWGMKRNVSAVRFKFRCNILICGKIIKEMPGSVASGTHCINEIVVCNLHWILTSNVKGVRALGDSALQDDDASVGYCISLH